MNAIPCLQELKADRPKIGSSNSMARALMAILMMGFCSGVIGFAAQDTQFRAARSVHLSYPAPEGTAFYNEIVVEQSANGSYFMACGWNTGYFGIQQLDGAQDKVALFSVWDPTHGDDAAAVKPEDRVEVLYQGDGVRIKRFGGEGTGGQCMWHCNWQLHETNRFLVLAKTEPLKCSYTAWISIDGTWKKLATFRTRTRSPLSGYYSFIEDFRRDGKSVAETRRARFGNCWVRTVKGDWQAISRARFTASNSEWESKDNIDAGTTNDLFFLATGGELSATTELKSFVALKNPITTGSPRLEAGILEP